MYLQVRIQDKGDPRPAYPEVGALAHKIVSIEPARCAILQDGTEGGKAAITFLIDLPDGKVGFMQFTEGMWEMVTGALKGANQRWSQEQ